MSHYALLSMIYMMVVVILFDRLHNSGLWNRALLSREEVDRMTKIWAACQES